MENSVKKKWFVWGLKFFSWTMFKWWLILTNFPAQPPKASFDRRRRSSKTTLQSQNTTTNQINLRWTKTKVMDFQVLRVDLDKWTEESKKAAALSRFFAVTFSLVARRLQFLSRRWTCVSWKEDKWSAESGQEPVGEEDLSEDFSSKQNFSILSLNH